MPDPRCILPEGWLGPPRTGWILHFIQVGSRKQSGLRQDSLWPLTVQAGICSLLVQAGLDLSSPYVQLICCWKIEQLPGQRRQHLGIFQFPTFMWLRQVSPPSQPGTNHPDVERGPGCGNCTTNLWLSGCDKPLTFILSENHRYGSNCVSQQAVSNSGHMDSESHMRPQSSPRSLQKARQLWVLWYEIILEPPTVSSSKNFLTA